MTTTPPVADRNLIARLAEDLKFFTVAAVETALGPSAVEALDREQATPARAVVAQNLGPCAVELEEQNDSKVLALVSLFMLGDKVPAELIDEALPNIGVDGLIELNLVTRIKDSQHSVQVEEELSTSASTSDIDTANHSDNLVRATVDLSPYHTDNPGDLWVVSDQTALQRGQTLPADHVLGVGRASLTLAALAPRHQVDTALDVGTGCGIQTLHLLTHAHHVTATDISARALAFTEFNLLLNSTALNLDPANLNARVQLVQGNMLEPVAGHEFDLVVTNPPFVISAGTTGTHTYRETGAEGDAVVQELISTIHIVLAPGGQAIMLGNWEIPAGIEWDTRLRSWLPENTDAWVIQRQTQDPAGYAETWLQDSSENLDPARYETRYQAYLENFATRNVEAIGFGWVWLRRRGENAAPLIRFENYQDPVIQPVGPYWANAIAAADYCVTHGIKDTHLSVPHHVTEERYQHFGDEHPEIIMARSGAGFCRAVVLDTATAAVMSAADGELPAGAIIQAVGDLLNLDTPGLQKLESRVQELAIDGFMVIPLIELH